MIPRSQEIVDAEDTLKRALVAVIGGTRPQVSVSQVKAWLREHFGIDETEVTVHLYQPEDFLIVFHYADDMMRVLHAPPPPNAPFHLILKK